jgi:hypothetical protein
MDARTWQLENGIARLRLTRCTAAVDPLNPAAGIHDFSLAGQPLDHVRLLQIDVPPIQRDDAAGQSECYVRGGDLVATYQQRPALQMRTQVYWRASVHAQDDALAAIELVASVQTNTLDSRPRLMACSELTAIEALRLVSPSRVDFEPLAPSSPPPAALDEPKCYLFRLPGQSFSYAEMVQRADSELSQCELTLSGKNLRVRLRHALFAEHLEKGVILRARVLGVLLDRSNDETAAARHFATFLSEQLPLTA